MAIKQVYVSKLGKDYKISEHFKLSEMQCKDGSDLVKYCTVLLAKLEELRAYGGYTIRVNSGYRTPAYNRSIGGATLSQHIEGTAADIVVYKNGTPVDAKLMCCLCQTLGFDGVGYISSRALHVDMGGRNYRGDERKGYKNNVNNDFYSYFGIKKSQIEALKVDVPETNVGNTKEEDVEMTQEQFDVFMDNYLAGRSDDDAASWSAEEREWAEKLGIVQGDGNNMGYKELVTKEQVVAMLGRFASELAKILKA